MSKSSEKVKRYRIASKARIIQSMGGECTTCGYNKCSDALELHHLDPDVKEFGIGRVRANIKSWAKVVVELRKCVLLCANCHREVHNGCRKLPENLVRFDERYLDYKAMLCG
jgi:hypothetical protein